MPVLLKADGTPLKDAAGNPLKTGQTVTDDMFGDCIVRGTVPLDKDEGLNVRIDWLGAKDSSKPKSRGAEHLTVKYPSAVGETTARRHTGAEYESGEVYAARGRNDADAGEHAIATSPQRCMTIILEPLGLTVGHFVWGFLMSCCWAKVVRRQTNEKKGRWRTRQHARSSGPRCRTA